MSKYTPGPWVKDYGRTVGHIKSLGCTGDRTPTVARYAGELVASSLTVDEIEANGHLIAAAPMMYEALQRVLAWLTNANAYSNEEIASSVVSALKAAGMDIE